MTTTTTDFQPGIFPDIPETDYHARRFGPPESISSTEAKRIITAPAVFRYYRDHAQPTTTAFDLGHVAHSLVLGTGLNIYVHRHESLRTKAARDDVQAHRDAGEVPISRSDYMEVRGMAAAVLTHPVAGPLLEDGTPEQSLYAVDGPTGVWMRGRVDWATHSTRTLIDLKTTVSADPDEWGRNVLRYGYALQREWYRSMWQALTGDHSTFLHILVEKQPPHLVSVIELDAEWEAIGGLQMRQALDTYARCLDTDEWPGYPADVTLLGPPQWVASQYGLDDLQVA